MAEITLSLDMTVDSALDAVVAAYAEREAIVFGPAHVTFQELGERINALAAGLLALGLRKGDKVAIIMPNSLEFVYAFFAIGKAGGVLVPINPLYKRREMQHILNDAEVTIALAAPQVWGNDVLGILREARPELPALRHIVVNAPQAPEDASAWQDVMASGQGQVVSGLNVPSDLYGLIYTSGTTGTPKGAMHTHHTMLAPVVSTQKMRREMFETPSPIQIARMMRTFASHAVRFVKWAGKQPTTISPSAFHAVAGYALMFGGVLAGYRTVIVERFSPAQVLELVAREHINTIVATPTMYSMMLSVPNFEKYDKSSLLYCAMAAAPCPPPLVREVRERFGCPVMIAFGATETAGLGLMTRFDDPDKMQVETVGKPSDDVKIKIVDPDHRELPVGQIGELAVLVDGIMVGYYHAPEATAQALDSDGWYYTGDLAVMDDKGYVRIVGRKKDMIIRGGQNIYPVEIETHLLTHPAVQGAAVVGVPDAMGGESVWAFIVLEPGATLTAKQVLDHCRGKIAPYKVPAEVRIVAELPLTPTAKIKKFELRELAIKELEAQGIHLEGKDFIVQAG